MSSNNCRPPVAAINNAKLAAGGQQTCPEIRGEGFRKITRGLGVERQMISSDTNTARAFVRNADADRSIETLARKLCRQVSAFRIDGGRLIGVTIDIVRYCLRVATDSG